MSTIFTLFYERDKSSDDGYGRSSSTYFRQKFTFLWPAVPDIWILFLARFLCIFKERKSICLASEAVDRAIIQLITGVKPDLGVYVQQEPFPSLIKDV